MSYNSQFLSHPSAYHFVKTFPPLTKILILSPVEAIVNNNYIMILSSHGCGRRCRGGRRCGGGRRLLFCLALNFRLLHILETQGDFLRKSTFVTLHLGIILLDGVEAWRELVLNFSTVVLNLGFELWCVNWFWAFVCELAALNSIWGTCSWAFLMNFGNLR